MSSITPLSLIVMLVMMCWCQQNTGNHVTRNDFHPHLCEQTCNLCFNTTPINDAPTVTCRCKHYAPSRITKKEDRDVQSITSRPGLAVRPAVTCVDDSSCKPMTNSHCHQQACRCDLGFDRNQDTCRNLTECYVFADDFTPFLHFCVWGHDLKMVNCLTLEDCGSICVNTPGCKSAEYFQPKRLCILGAYSWYEFPDGRDTRFNQSTFLQRQCMTWQS